MKKVSGPSSCQYYQTLNKEDYYAKEKNAQGYWLGSGATELGLTGSIEPNDERLKRLFEGRHPTNPDIVLRQGGTTERKRQDGTVLKPVSALDITCTAPKSVSVDWALSHGVTSEKLLKAHRDAFAKVPQELERECMSRRGRGGSGGYEQVKPIMAAFEHGTSRENDPNLHTHLLLINVGLRHDGKGASLDLSRFMGKGEKALVHKLGAIYRNALKENLERDLGLKTETKQLKHGTSFELTHVPKEICKAFSTRRAQIEAVLHPSDTAKQVQVKVLATRKAKDTRTPEHELFASWKKRASALGFEPGRQQEREPNRHVVADAAPKEPSVVRKTPEEYAKEAARIDAIESMLAVMKILYERHVNRVISERQEAVSKAFDRAKVESEERTKRFETSVTFRYVTRQMSHKTYRKLTRPQPKTKFGIYAASIAGHVSKKQRDRLLSINGHRTKEDWLKSKPKTRLGINFAYATHRISNHERLALLWHHGHLRREMEAERLPLFPSVAYPSRAKLPPFNERPPHYQLFGPNIKVEFIPPKQTQQQQGQQKSNHGQKQENTPIRERERER